jgi:hypothetical protein
VTVEEHFNINICNTISYDIFVCVDMQRNSQQMSFSSLSISKRKLKSKFFNQINLLLDWASIDSEIKKYTPKALV